MELWAAIDLLKGRVVSPVRGKLEEAIQWPMTSLEAGHRWAEEGATGLHIVDLDAAFGRGSNQETIKEVLRESSIPVQVGGGVRSLERAEAWLAKGAARVVLGTMAYREPGAVKKMIDRHGPERLTIALDYKGGEVVTAGWTRGEHISQFKALSHFQALGANIFLATAVDRDGTGTGPDLENLRGLVQNPGARILASGGIRHIEDLLSLKQVGVEGTVLGRAIYEGGLPLKRAAEALRGG